MNFVIEPCPKSQILRRFAGLSSNKVFSMTYFLQKAKKTDIATNTLKTNNPFSE